MSQHKIALSIDHQEYPTLGSATLHITVDAPIEFVRELKNKMRPALEYASETAYLENPISMEAGNEKD